jgi:hypothetical protein
MSQDEIEARKLRAERERDQCGGDFPGRRGIEVIKGAP